MAPTNVKKHDTSRPVLVARELYSTEGNRLVICPENRFPQLHPLFENSRNIVFFYFRKKELVLFLFSSLFFVSKRFVSSVV